VCTTAGPTTVERDISARSIELHGRTPLGQLDISARCARVDLTPDLAQLNVATRCACIDFALKITDYNVATGKSSDRLANFAGTVTTKSTTTGLLPQRIPIAGRSNFAIADISTFGSKRQGEFLQNLIGLRVRVGADLFASP